MLRARKGDILIPMPNDDISGEVTCFVIGPIGDKDAEPGSDAQKTFEDAIQVLEYVIEPACAAYGFAVVRSDRMRRPGEITEQVCRHLRDAYLVVADLSGANPNVMYELGLRHTTGKLTIQIGERDKLPFDINMIRTILFKRTEAGLVDARRKLAAAIAAGLEGGGDPVTATRVWFEQGVATVDSSNNIVDAEDGDEPGFLEKLAESSEGMNSAIMTLQTIAEINNEINTLVTASAERMQVANKSGADPSARVFIANELATQIAEPASRLQVVVGEFSQSMSRVDFGVRYTLEETLKKRGDAQAEAFKAQVAELVQTYRGVFESTRQYREAVVENANATRSLRKAFLRIVASLDVVLETERIFEGWRDLLASDAGA
jgi:hypothetical protein